MPAVLSDTTCMLCILTTAHSQQGFVGKCRAVFLGSKAGWNHSANATEGIMETSKVQQHPPAMYKHEVAYFLKISEGAGRKAADRDEACMKDDQRSPKPAEKKKGEDLLRQGFRGILRRTDKEKHALVWASWTGFEENIKLHKIS